jgi:predicted aminopeptidase
MVQARRRWLRWLAAGCGTFVALALLVCIGSREVRYVVRAAVEEARILLARQPLEDLINDPETPADRRAAFRLVLDARDFAEQTLGLEAGDTYTTYTEVGRDTLVLVLSASPRDRLTAHTWWYPIVGSVPYKGFFDVEEAQAEARRLEARGLDAYLRPSGAFSTLGWFNDPLLSTAMSDDPVQLVATVIHELAHNTLYVAGRTRFNESFASFVGYRGAEVFFAIRGDSTAARRAAAIWHDEMILGCLYAELIEGLEDVYGRELPGDAIEVLRDSVFAEVREALRGPVGAEFELYAGERLAAREFNNASVIAWTLYRWRLDTFGRVFEAAGGDVREAVEAIVERVRSRPPGTDPYEALEP